jgi:hypothetical protein
MINFKSSFSAKRSTRRRFVHSMRRCIGLERLERRTVFANDLGADLEAQLDACTAIEFQPQALLQPISESQVRSTSEASVYQQNVPNSLVEVSSSSVSIENGDFVIIEVPSSSFADMTIHDTYFLTYSYAQNYFSDIAGNATFVSNFQSQAQDNRIDSWSANSRALADDSVGSGSLFLEPVSNTTGNEVQMLDRTLVLASLSATTDFEATIRVYDNSQINPPMGAGQTDFGARQLPSEIRIEPNLTSATVLPDPGPTITRTIILNRQAEGLVLQEQPTKQIGPTKPEPMERLGSDGSISPNSAPTLAPASIQPSLAKTSRSTVAIKTIDISQVRRHDVARPWLHSSLIQNTARPRDFGFEKKPTIVTAGTATAPPAQPTIASKSEKSARWNSRVSATRLQPVEFLLAPSDLETEKVAVQQGKPLIATDIAMSGFAGAGRIDRLENDIFLAWLSANELGIQAGSLSSEESNSQSAPVRHGSEAWFLEATAEMQGLAQYPPANANRDTLKSLVRKASESLTGQAFLATLSTIAVQQKESSDFGSKSAWEYVTRPKQSSQA